MPRRRARRRCRTAAGALKAPSACRPRARRRPSAASAERAVARGGWPGPPQGVQLGTTGGPQRLRRWTQEPNAAEKITRVLTLSPTLISGCRLLKCAFCHILKLQNCASPSSRLLVSSPCFRQLVNSTFFSSKPRVIHQSISLFPYLSNLISHVSYFYFLYSSFRKRWW